MLCEAVRGGELMDRLCDIGALDEAAVRFYSGCVVSALGALVSKAQQPSFAIRTCCCLQCASEQYLRALKEPHVASATYCSTVLVTCSVISSPKTCSSTAEGTSKFATSALCVIKSR
eukprot:SAG11_NODE_1219_length_5494_cov_4.408526_2_plen_117_part_00